VSRFWKLTFYIYLPLTNKRHVLQLRHQKGLQASKQQVLRNETLLNVQKAEMIRQGHQMTGWSSRKSWQKYRPRCSMWKPAVYTDQGWHADLSCKKTFCGGFMTKIVSQYTLQHGIFLKLQVSAGEENLVRRLTTDGVTLTSDSWYRIVSCRLKINHVELTWSNA
jgi:hypothetical protein